MSDIASLVTLRSILDIEIARTYQWDAATIITSPALIARAT